MSRLPPWLLLIVIGLIVVTFPVWALLAHLTVPYLLALWPLFLLIFVVRWYLKRRGGSQIQ